MSQRSAPTRSHARARRTGSATARYFFALAILLAATIWVFLAQPAERRLSRRLDLRDDLVRRIDLRRRAAHRLRIRREALQGDPQTIESELRRAGYGRKGDHVIVPGTSGQAPLKTR